MFENRRYMIFNVADIEDVNFGQVLETSADTVRKSVDETLTFVKWDGMTVPSSVDALTGTDGPYTHSEILDILSTATWSPSGNDMP